MASKKGDGLQGDVSAYLAFMNGTEDEGEAKKAMHRAKDVAAKDRQRARGRAAEDGKFMAQFAAGLLGALVKQVYGDRRGKEVMKLLSTKATDVKLGKKEFLFLIDFYRSGMNGKLAPEIEALEKRVRETVLE